MCVGCMYRCMYRLGGLCCVQGDGKEMRVSDDENEMSLLLCVLGSYMRGSGVFVMAVCVPIFCCIGLGPGWWPFQDKPNVIVLFFS